MASCLVPGQCSRAPAALVTKCAGSPPAWQAGPDYIAIWPHHPDFPIQQEKSPLNTNETEAGFGHGLTSSRLLSVCRLWPAGFIWNNVFLTLTQGASSHKFTQTNWSPRQHCTKYKPTRRGMTRNWGFGPSAAFRVKVSGLNWYFWTPEEVSPNRIYGRRFKIENPRVLGGEKPAGFPAITGLAVRSVWFKAGTGGCAVHVAFNYWIEFDAIWACGPLKGW